MLEVNAKVAADTLEDVQIKAGELKITPLKAITPEAADALADRLYGMVPLARVTDLLAEVDGWTGFSSAFTHLHTSLPANDRHVVLTAILADATNMGLARMADACAAASYRQLAWNAGWHLREDTYRGGTAILANAQHNQPLAALFGTANVSSSDGQAFPTAGRGEAVGAFNAHYGNEATALFYTHVSNRHAPFYTASITGAGEAAHVIDGLLYHEADLSIATHHTDDLDAPHVREPGDDRRRWVSAEGALKPLLRAEPLGLVVNYQDQAVGPPFRIGDHHTADLPNPVFLLAREGAGRSGCPRNRVNFSFRPW